ncbi:MAG TPA: carbohydrate porin [Woeseiaceae bacterium]
MPGNPVSTAASSGRRSDPLGAAALLAGTWLAASQAHADSGWQFDAVYTGEVLSNVSGGIRTGTRYLDNLDLMLEVDLAEAWGFGDGTLFVYGLYNNGGTFTGELVGDLMAVSNIDAPHAFRLYEFWYELDGEDWSVRAGLYDLNSEFDVNETGSLFIHSSHGIGAGIAQTGQNGPGIFPVSALALRAQLGGDGLTARVAVLDGVPGDPDDPSSNEIRLSGDEGALLFAEVELPLAGSGRLWSGAWRYTAEFERLAGGEPDNDNGGWYVGIESGIPLGDARAAAFLRYGRVNGAINPFRGYFGSGLVLERLPGLRSDDRVGIGVASGDISEDYRGLVRRRDGSAPARETTWELTFRRQVNDRFAIQPDLQYVKNPAEAGHLDDAWIVGLRFELTW